MGAVATLAGMTTSLPPGPVAPALPSPARVVLFDLDGTLCDTEAGIVAHLAMALEGLGRPVPERAALRRCVGPRWEDG